MKRSIYKGYGLNKLIFCITSTEKPILLSLNLSGELRVLSVKQAFLTIFYYTKVLTMPGYQYQPGTVVNNIKSLLRERYKQGFPIIKEIIQNANDGRATNLEFGISKGLLVDTVEHPLLKIPALFFVNDGTFSKSDKEAIRCFGIDANANDKGKIGKFGLGQKSIFHFCEAFFYIAHSENIPEGCGDFINPWANANGIDPKRREWEELTNKDRQIIEKYLTEQKLINPELNYFILWIPLRQKMVDDRCILANYYPDVKSVESNLPQDMKMRIGQLLPLLRYLKNVRYWLENTEGSLQPQFNISLDNKQICKRFIYPNSQSEIIQEDERDLQGNIIIDSTVNSNEISFAGKERILPSSDFSLLINDHPQNLSENFWNDLQQSEFWTKRLSIDENAEESLEPDKSIPHCAIVFTKQSLTNKSKARLMLQWSVFLPLASDDNDSNNEAVEQEAYEVIDCEGNQDYTVFLHGYFFLDSGRKYIEGLKKIRTNEFTQKTPTNEDEMIEQWNYLLATKGTLKLFLPSLEKFSKIHKLSTQDISNLCLGISRSSFFRSSVYKQSICSQYQWVLRIKPSVSGWELIPIKANANVRSLPGIPPNWQVFPGLQKLAATHYLIDNQKPNLLLNEKFLDWQEIEIVNILTSLDLNLLFADFQNLNYLYEFLLQSKKLIGKNLIQNSLINLLETAFINIQITQLKQDKINQVIKKIVELIHLEKRFKLKKFTEDEQIIQLILKELYDLDIKQPLLIYELFEPNSPSNGSLSNEQVTSILTRLSQLLKEKTIQIEVKFIIEQVIEHSNSLETVLNQVSNLPLFFGYNHQQNKNYIYSYLDLQRFQAKHLLFKGKYQTDVIKDTQAALPECELIFIDLKISKLLEKTNKLKAIPQFNHQSCLQLLATKPELANFQQRANLLQELINHV